jgi:hypothetical protein
MRLRGTADCTTTASRRESSLAPNGSPRGRNPGLSTHERGVTVPKVTGRTAPLIAAVVFAAACSSSPAERLTASQACESSDRREVPPGVHQDSVEADMDGDGDTERFIAWAESDPKLYVIHVRVEDDEGFVIDREVGTKTLRPDVAGATDVDENGRAEVWIADHESVSLVVLDGCALKPVERVGPESITEDEIEKSNRRRPEEDLNGWYPASFTALRESGSSGFQGGTVCADVVGDDEMEVVAYEWNDEGLSLQDETTGWWHYYAYELKADRVHLVAKKSKYNRAKSDAFAWRDGFRCEDVAVT